MTGIGTGVVAAAVDVGGLLGTAHASRPALGPAAAAPKAVPTVTTWDRTVQRASYDPAAGYQGLVAGPGEPHVVRTDLWDAQGHVTMPLAAFAQMTDLHIIDDQSPARLEFLDRYADAGSPHNASYPTDSAYRPHEYLSTQVVDAMCQAISGVGTGPLTNLPLQFTIVTGDAIDNCQHNENRWYIDLLDGGQTIVPDSGSIGLDQSLSNGSFDAVDGVPNPGADDFYYHPSIDGADFGNNRFTGTGGLGFPLVHGLLTIGSAVLGAARRPYTSHGLGMKWYSAYGNHDAMWQGNVPPDSNIVPVGDVTGGRKWTGTTTSLPDDYEDLGTLTELSSLLNLTKTPVAADPNRRLLSRKAFIQDHFNTAGLPVGHGFQGVGIDKAYYTIPAGSDDLIQYVTLDTTNNNTDGFGQGGASGSLDDDQFDWLQQLLKANSSRYVDEDGHLVTQGGVKDRMIVLFGHHTLLTMDNLDDGILGGIFGKRHTGDELKALLLRFPNVIAFVNGHTHANKITPHATPSGSPVTGGFWEISTASHIDWPIQSRIVEIAAGAGGTDAGSGTPLPDVVSIFTTMIDPAAPLSFGGDTSTPAQLASLARELATNDPQETAVKPGHNGIVQRMGAASDRNTQLLLAAPFPLSAPVQLGSPIAVARNDDGRLELFGTTRSGDLYRTGQKTAGGGLLPWTKIGSGGYRSVATGTNRNGEVALFAVTPSDTLDLRRQTTAGAHAYTAAAAVSDSRFTSVTALRDQWGGLELFATTKEGAIHHCWQKSLSSDDWVPWVKLGGRATRIAVEVGGDGKAVLVGVAPDGSLFRRKKLFPNGRKESEWGPVTALDGRLDSVAMARNTDGRLALFGTNSDGQVLQRFETASGSAAWTAWAQLPTRVPGSASDRMRHIAAERNGGGRIELFAVDDTGALLTAEQRNPGSTGWSAWADLGFALRAGHALER